MIELFVRGLIHRINLTPVARRRELRMQLFFGAPLVSCAHHRRPRRPAGVECLSWPAYQYGDGRAVERQRVEVWS